jgi:hypothetical protein
MPLLNIDFFRLTGYLCVTPQSSDNQKTKFECMNKTRPTSGLSSVFCPALRAVHQTAATDGLAHEHARAPARS